MIELKASFHETLFVSPVDQVNRVKTRFKRPVKVYKKERGICKRCQSETIRIIRVGVRKQFLEITQEICSLGHVEIELRSFLRSELLLND